jgi:hypothetical protein
LALRLAAAGGAGAGSGVEARLPAHLHTRHNHNPDPLDLGPSFIEWRVEGSTGGAGSNAAGLPECWQRCNHIAGRDCRMGCRCLSLSANYARTSVWERWRLVLADW